MLIFFDDLPKGKNYTEKYIGLKIFEQLIIRRSYDLQNLYACFVFNLFECCLIASC